MYSSTFIDDFPDANAAAEGGTPIREGQGRDSEASQETTRAALLRIAPWLILAFWTVLTVTVFR